MIHYRLAGPALALLIAISAPAALAQTEGTHADTVVATVNGEAITLGHMIVLRSRLPADYANAPAEVLFDGILEQLIQQQALASQAGDMSRTSELVMENERRALMANEALLTAGKDAVTEEMIQDLYNDTVANAAPVPEFNASHILVETEEEALAIIEEIEGGADFAEVAKEKSTGPSGPGGGDLGWFGPGMMVPAFEEAVVELEVGAVSAPVKTQFGWHVIKLSEKRLKDAPPLEEVQAELETQIRQVRVQKAIEQMTEEADVDRSASEGVDPTVLTNLGLLE